MKRPPIEAIKSAYEKTHRFTPRWVRRDITELLAYIEQLEAENKWFKGPACPHRNGVGMCRVDSEGRCLLCDD